MARCAIQEIAKRAGAAGIPFLVIGNLIVPHGRRAQLSKLLGDLEMAVKNDAANFVQLDPPDANGMEVDLISTSSPGDF